MRKNYKSEFNRLVLIAFDFIDVYGYSENRAIAISFTKYGKDKLNNYNQKFLSESTIDFELGVISEEEFKVEKCVYEIIKKSIELGAIY